MEKKTVQVNAMNITIVKSDTPIIVDAQSALDLMMTIQHCDNSDRMAINKQAIIEDFFKLSTGIAGEVLQKFTNYSIKIAIVGDFSAYTSKPLKDFIYECNQGNAIFFVSDEQAAINKFTLAV